jgi:hypothetical protein
MVNKHSELLGIVLVVVGILALISGYLLEESLLFGTGFLLPSLAVLLRGRGSWFDELPLERKAGVSAVLAVAGAVMIVFASKDWNPATLTLRLIGDSFLLLAGMWFFLLGLTISAFCMRSWSGKRKRSEHNKFKEE